MTDEDSAVTFLTTTTRALRAPLIALATAAVALSGCTSTPAGSGGESSPTATGASSTAATPGAAATTGRPTTEATGAPTTGEAVGAESAESARSIAVDLITRQGSAVATPGAAGQPLRDAVFANEALLAANAQAILYPSFSAARRADLPYKADDVVVLAVSRGTAYPRTILVKTSVPSGQLALLLLQAASAEAGYRIVHQSRPMPSSVIGAFDSPVVGSAPAADGSGLSVAPDALMTAYAAGLAHPAPPADPARPYADDAFAASLRANISSSQSALGRAVTLAQVHNPVRIVATMRTGGNKGAFYFGILERRDTITETTAGELKANTLFRLLAGKTTIDKQAVLTAYEFVVWYAPTSGLAVVAAAGDQTVGASGS